MLWANAAKTRCFCGMVKVSRKVSEMLDLERKVVYFFQLLDCLAIVAVVFDLLMAVLIAALMLPRRKLLEVGK